jgi:hypothetical protein|tara:strand:+ start:317 stop:496 length:180 start_codon:yes stop_codon:yes gene_type:complete
MILDLTLASFSVAWVNLLSKSGLTLYERVILGSLFCIRGIIGSHGWLLVTYIYVNKSID